MSPMTTQLIITFAITLFLFPGCFNLPLNSCKYFNASNIFLSPEETGCIKSEGYPNQYTPNTNRTWLLIAPPVGKFRLIVTNLSLEHETNCRHDSLIIFDGKNTSAKTIAVLCGAQKDSAYLSSGSEVLISFVTDSIVEESGFHLSFMVEMGDDCNKTYTGENGTVKSPNYPSNYANNLNCWILIKPTNPTVRIVVKFQEIHVESTRTDCYDYIEIFDGVSDGSKSLGKRCRGKPLKVSTSGTFLINFRSDDTNVDKGFLLSYSTIDANAKLSSDVQCRHDKLKNAVASPANPKPGDTCTSLLEAPLNSKIALTFEKITMDGHRDCELDFVSVWDGNQSDAKLLAKYCGQSNETQQTIISTSTQLRVNYRFISFWENHTATFLARYKIIQTLNTDHALATFKNYQQATKNITLLKGEKHVIDCAFNNNSYFGRTWMKDLIPLSIGEQNAFPGLILLSNYSIRIESMSWTLEGMYTCIAASETEVKVFNTWIAYEPRLEDTYCDIKFNIAPKSVNVTEGSSVFLRCSTLNQNTEIKWQKDNVILTPTSHPRINIIFPGLLLIKSVRLTDAASYTCTAKKVGGCHSSTMAVLQVQPKPKFELQSRCGMLARKKTNYELAKIVGGEVAMRGSHPWQAMLISNTSGTLCGGTVIDKEWVITAAHCVIRYNYTYFDNFNVKVGKYDSKKSESEEQVLRVRNITFLPNYYFDIDIDIALLHVDPIVFNEYVRPICLGLPDFMQVNVYSKLSYGVVTGWGQIENHGVKSRYLKAISMKLVESSRCESSVNKRNVVTDNVFCAEYVGDIREAGPCDGDNGGPFAVKVHERWYLAGILSWDHKCSAGKYTYYTNVGYYYNWIVSTVNSKNY